MNPIRTENSNFTYTGPRPDIADLPCQREDGVVAAVFELTDEERTMIANGAQVRLGIWQEPIPPVSVSIVREKPAPGPEDLRCQGCGNLYLASRRLARCGWCDGELHLVAASKPQPKAEPDEGRIHG